MSSSHTSLLSYVAYLAPTSDNGKREQNSVTCALA